jgi:hypothetical protein
MMSRPETEKSILEKLKGREVSSVSFVRDYLQLDFDGPYLNLFVWPQVLRNGTTFDFSNPGYRDALCELIGQTVVGIFEENGQDVASLFCRWLYCGGISAKQGSPRPRGSRIPKW